MSRRTGFPPHVRELICDRASGLCERCGEFHSDAAIHHRRPRASGGTRRPETNAASNGCLLCAACHLTVESHRFQAYSDGWLVRQSQSPLTVPLLRRGAWSLIDDDGFVYRVATPENGVAS